MQFPQYKYILLYLSMIMKIRGQPKQVTHLFSLKLYIVTRIASVIRHLHSVPSRELIVLLLDYQPVSILHNSQCHFSNNKELTKYVFKNLGLASRKSCCCPISTSWIGQQRLALIQNKDKILALIQNKDIIVNASLSLKAKYTIIQSVSINGRMSNRY